MLLNAMVAPLTLLAVALPFLFAYSQPPSSNFWPLVAAWTCGAVLALLAVCRARGLRRSLPGGQASDGRAFLASQLAAGLLLAALLAGMIGLLQYFLGDPGMAPWVQPSTPGQAIGNLRQRNQQASLLSLGVWALLWLVAQVQAHLGAASGVPATPLQRALLGDGRPSPLLSSWLVGMLLVWTITLLAVASAATASRTGAMQWLLILALLVLWRGASSRLVLGLVVIGAGVLRPGGMDAAAPVAGLDGVCRRGGVRPPGGRSAVVQQPAGAVVQRAVSDCPEALDGLGLG